MKYIIDDPKYHFKSAFDTDTGAYVRTGILDQAGRDTGDDPFRASFPHLIDVGIMGHCIHGRTGLCLQAGVQCYQSGFLIEEPNMTLADFTRILKECQGRCNQIALGGRGDPDQHEHFEEILRLTRDYGLVPNFTTSGYGMTRQLAEISRRYCGAVAVSWYRNSYTLDAIDHLIRAGVRTNIHYVLGSNTIDEAIDRLRANTFPSGINAVIFLLHKPAGQGTRQHMLSPDDPRVAEFYRLFEVPHPFRIGIDSCSVPGALRMSKGLIPESLDTCEGGRFSCYIGADLTMVPCSFDQPRRYQVSLRDRTIEDAWNSEAFDQFRNHLKRACPDCAIRSQCMGGCPLMPEIVLCKDKNQGGFNL